MLPAAGLKIVFIHLVWLTAISLKLACRLQFLRQLCILFSFGPAQVARTRFQARKQAGDTLAGAQAIYFMCYASRNHPGDRRWDVMFCICGFFMAKWVTEAPGLKAVMQAMR